MPTDDALIEWTKTDAESEAEAAIADVTVFADGRVRLGPRLANGEVFWGSLSEDELNELRRLLLDELRLLEIDGETLSREVEAAAAARKAATESRAFELVTAPQMDASTTLLRAADEAQSTEIRYYDLFGDAEAYPEVEALQRLRRIELRLLEIVGELVQG